jgi:catechol 2,3-dioxygenase-like lactoylglutathione lyase family enzyme
VYNRHHLNVSSIEAHRKFWEALGGKPIRTGRPPQDVVEFPNVLVFLDERVPTGGTKGTTVNHICFNVPDIRTALDRVEAAGYPIVTRAEMRSHVEVKDGIAFNASTKGHVAFVMGPDDMKVEFLQDESMSEAIRLHHIHFASRNVPAMKAWYVDMLNAVPGMRGAFEAADLPGVNLSWSPSEAPVVGTRGRVLDRIGFEVPDLRQLCDQLLRKGVRLDQPYTRMPPLATACITDPEGTSIQLTERLTGESAR